MKKLLILLIIPIFFLLLNTNFTTATNSLDIIDDYFFDNNIVLDEEYQDGIIQEAPEVIIKTNYNRIYRQPDNQNTYAFTAYYQINGNYSNITIDDYYFITKQYISIVKGLDVSINSYEIINITYFGSGANYTRFHLRVTLQKDFVDEFYSFDEQADNYIGNFFSEAVFYVKYVYLDDDYNTGYNVGYDIGYNNGFNDGTNSVLSNIIGLVPTIIILVFVFGIIISYLERSDKK